MVDADQSVERWACTAASGLDSKEGTSPVEEEVIAQVERQEEVVIVLDETWSREKGASCGKAAREDVLCCIHQAKWPSRD